TIIKEDDYYKDQSFLPFEERLKTNYDHPDAFDHDLLLRHLDMLKNGEEIEKPTYDFVTHNRSNVTEIVKPTKVMILEGLFVLEGKSIRDRLDIKVFVDTPADIRFIRRLQRDMNERGRSMDSVINQYCNTVRVMHDEFVEPTKKYADIIIPSGGWNVVAVDLLETKIDSILKNKVIK
ncbi:MAG: uridine kinase, partial [Erysipelotrichaceae bacterium]|nr:uridine kinase [Erysipelotrichaceae bacterium]